MKIPIAESDLILPKVCSVDKTVGTHMKRRGPSQKKVSVIKASGSGNQETKFNVCLFSPDAKRSGSGSPK